MGQRREAFALHKLSAEQVQLGVAVGCLPTSGLHRRGEGNRVGFSVEMVVEDEGMDKVGQSPSKGIVRH